MSRREVTFQAMLRAIATNRMDLIALRPCQILIPFQWARGGLTFIRRALQRLQPNLLFRWGRRQGMVMRCCCWQDENNCVWR